MELPKKINKNEIALSKIPFGTKAIDVRRQMFKISNVVNSLIGSDKYVFAASVKTLISEIDDKTLIEKTSQMFKFIAIDVGYRIPSDMIEWQYTCTRLVDVLKRYYSDLTLSEIKLAFEMATMGQLNEWLPKDSQGNADKNHYQQFNADYFAKIINAYKNKRNNVFAKAYDALPQQDSITDEQNKYYSNETKSGLILSFIEYKYHNKVYNMSSIRQMLYYNLLVRVGLADAIDISNDDLKNALSETLTQIAKGMVNYYEAIHIRKRGIEHETVKVAALGFSEKRMLFKAFDEMISDEIQIKDYIKIEI